MVKLSVFRVSGAVVRVYCFGGLGFRAWAVSGFRVVSRSRCGDSLP